MEFVQSSSMAELGEERRDPASDGCEDFRGRVADKRSTGGWKASPFIIVNEVAERLAFFAIAVNILRYLTLEMHQSLPTAAPNVSNWIGAAYVLTLLGAFMADAYLGRFMTIIVFSGIYAVGMVLLTLSASMDTFRPPPCTAKPCIKATSGQTYFLYGALALISLGTGGIKPCVSSFGADQFDEADPVEVQRKYAFFNWFFFAINFGVLIGITIVPYLIENIGWGWGFGAATGFTVLSIIILISGVRFYRYRKPTGSPFTRFFQVLVAAVRNHIRGIKIKHEANLFEVSSVESDIVGARKLTHTNQYKFLDKAAVIAESTNPESIPQNRWRLCTITQVEELKSIIRIFPIWASTIALEISFAQFSTFFVSQAAVMNRKLSPNFTMPTGSTNIFGTVPVIILIPAYELFLIPLLRKWTGHRRGITSLQRMGVGLFLSIFALISAAVVENKRRNHPDPSSMIIFWLIPQYSLVGAAEMFTYVGQLEFFYDEATDGTRSISSSLFLAEIGLGSWLNTALVKIIESATGGEEKGWLRNNLNQSKLDYLYWVLTAINVVNFLVYLWVARRYKCRGGAVAGSAGSEALERVEDD